MEDTVSSSELWLLIEVNRSHLDLRSNRYCEDTLVMEEHVLFQVYQDATSYKLDIYQMLCVQF
jgi:hypothetical protein